ncbi:MAG: LysE family transporter [Desulfobacterales bacterium]|nr:LysE family transporter [Desulfobacterales bacterium]MCP4163844.1 LysE family transporter [Deltaproteobacteria bacterium]
MEYLAPVFTISFVTLLAIMSPGPNFFLVVSSSLSKSRRNGVITSVGIGLGSFTYAVAGFLGIAAVLSSSETAFLILRIFGGAYLSYLGISMIFKNKSSDLTKTKKISKEHWLKSFVTGLTTNLSNPKAMMFYISLFSMNAEPMPLFYRFLTCFLIFVISASWYSFVAVSFSHEKIKSFYNRRNRFISGFFGTAIVAFGLKIIFNGK